MSQEGASGETPPIFSAVTSSARQLFSLFRCIGFLPKALVQISGDGLRVTVDDSRVMQGHAFAEKRLFNTYDFNPPSPPSQHLGPDGTAATSTSNHSHEEAPDGSADSDPTLSFNISLTSLLECLQIFGAEASRENSKWRSSGIPDRPEDSANANANPQAVFDPSSLKVGGTCRFSYDGEGYPLCLMMEENGTLTTCELTTYEHEAVEEIPLAREALAMKIIMKADWLHDAVQELDGSSERLILKASPQHPNFSISAAGPLGSTVVEFTYDATRTSDTLDTFIVPEPILFSYKFSLLKNAIRTMSIASKVSIRGDRQGVLSLQFMVEHEGGSPSFVDFRFLPFASDGRDSEED